MDSKVKIACIIDDDEIYTFTVKRIIARAEIAEQSIFFDNGASALDFFRANAQKGEILPELILLDINMPQLNGWQFLEEYVKLVPNLAKKTSIFIVSSSIDADDYARAKKYKEVSGFIAKPITVENLKSILAKLPN